MMEVVLRYLWLYVWVISWSLMVGCGRVKNGGAAMLPVGGTNVSLTTSSGSYEQAAEYSKDRLPITDRANATSVLSSDTNDEAVGSALAKRKKHQKFVICPGYLRGNTREKVVALTFDDGPSPFTLQILDILAEEQVPGTFFVIGVNVLKYPEILNRIYREGHLIGNHTYQHRNLANLNGSEANSALVRNSNVIYRRLGVYPRLYRSPYGSCNSESRQAARDLGLVSVNWSSVADDYHVHRTNAEQIADEIIALVRPGAIIDLHDGGGDRHKTVEAVRIIIQRLRESGYRFVPLAELIHQTPYYDKKQWQSIIAKQKTNNTSPESLAGKNSQIDSVDVAATVKSDVVVGQQTPLPVVPVTQDELLKVANHIADGLEEKLVADVDKDRNSGSVGS